MACRSHRAGRGGDAMLKTLLRTTACLALSAAAFIVITKMDASAAKRRGSAPETTAPKDDPPKDAPPKPPAPRTPPTKLTPADSTTTMPDWKGKRLSVAKREARKLGFTVAAIDGDDAPGPAHVAGRYRIRRQLTKAGTPVEPGATVEVRVREIAETAEGY